MQIHGPSSSGEKIEVRLNPGNPIPFAVVHIDSVRIYVETPAEADRLIKAAVAAKDMLLGETSEPLPPPSVQDMREIFFPEDPDGSKHGHFDAPSAAAVAEGVEGEPPHLVRMGEVICDAHSEPQVAGEPMTYYVCTAQAGHAGPEHVAFLLDGIKEWGRWPVASPLAPPAPNSTPAAGIPATDGPTWCGRESHDHTCCDGARGAFGVKA